MNVLDFQRMRDQKKKISMVTCYDYWTARIVAESDVDCVLVGDSVAMVMHGYPTTVNATIPMMEMHTAAVARGAGKKFIIADLPFLANRKSLDVAMDAVQTLVQAGAHAIKLEGVTGHEDIIKHIVDSGIPVMGHIGLTLQFVHQLGGFKVQGRDDAGAQRLLEQAKTLEELGCFAIVLECMPPAVAQQITESLHIPTIGIGAGEKTSGQVLVLQDLLGGNKHMSLKFLKTYGHAHDDFLKALNQYNEEVKQVKFPDETHYY
jgi:3-methyl-2-oxobutanoate hydroxymethyltransferase